MWYSEYIGIYYYCILLILINCSLLRRLCELYNNRVHFEPQHWLGPRGGREGSVSHAAVLWGDVYVFFVC